MKSKIVLDLGTGDDFCLFGISCHLKDYRFCWLLNQQLDTDLRRVGDFSPGYINAGDGNPAFPLYYCDENIRYETFYLIGNHSAGGFSLLEKHAQLDYLFFIHELAYPAGAAGMVQEIRKIPQVLTAFEIHLAELKEGRNLVNGIELCLVEYRKELKNKRPLSEYSF